MQSPLVHHHLLVRAVCKHRFTKSFNLDDALFELVEAINMKVLAGPFSTYCMSYDYNEGWSGTVIIETSNITFHSWQHNGVVQLDVYSCAPFDVETVVDWLRQFRCEKIDYKFLDREKGFTEISNESDTTKFRVVAKQ